ncbi:deoxynucleotide monophosphate kinase family protein [Crossiella sp. NPDC003009]
MILPSIGLVGPPGAGKDTLAALLAPHGYVRVALADPLRALALALDPIVTVTGGEPVRLFDVLARYGWEDAKRRVPEVRRTLQRLGTEVGRELAGPDVWLNRAVARIAELRAAGTPAVITDVRFANEAESLRRLGVVLVRVRRDVGRIDADAHESERQSAAIPTDVEIDNRGSLAELGGRARGLVDLVRAGASLFGGHRRTPAGTDGSAGQRLAG